MAVHKETYQTIRAELEAKGVTLVAVSKTKPVEDILELYELGQRDFGENYVQELVEKAERLPVDIRWHFIGHLQSNKAKYIAPFVNLVHGVDSWKLLQEISKQGEKNGRVIDCLLQVHIAREETKFGLDEEELTVLLRQAAKLNQLNQLNHVRIRGLMGMASFSEDMNRVRGEFRNLKRLFDQQAGGAPSLVQFNTLSMGMSSDYRVAVEEGSNLVRIGSLLFGERTKQPREDSK
ncbi:MAG: YggS family pyridoxal phosphate-dependent enzyme [Sphingobacteriales bacterium]|nr:YggS family pyridoxal phosphate-dependent enzyme [Sphingobacteriales bacterium]